MSTFITRKELAEELKLTEHKIGDLEKEGLPVINVSERIKRYDLEAVKQWFAEINNMEKDIN